MIQSHTHIDSTGLINDEKGLATRRIRVLVNQYTPGVATVSLGEVGSGLVLVSVDLTSEQRKALIVSLGGTV